MKLMICHALTCIPHSTSCFVSPEVLLHLLNPNTFPLFRKYYQALKSIPKDTWEPWKQSTRVTHLWQQAEMIEGHCMPFFCCMYQSDVQSMDTNFVI